MPSDDLTLYANHVAPFVAATFSLFGKRLTIIPQFRLQISTLRRLSGHAGRFSHTYVSPEPAAARCATALTERVALKGAVGLYTQPPAPRARCRACSATPTCGPQRATHYVPASTSRSPPRCASRPIGFWKDMRDLVVRGRGPRRSACWSTTGSGAPTAPSCWCASS